MPVMGSSTSPTLARRRLPAPPLQGLSRAAAGVSGCIYLGVAGETVVLHESNELYRRTTV